MTNSDVHSIILREDDGNAWEYKLRRLQESSAVSEAEGDGCKVSRVSVNNV